VAEQANERIRIDAPTDACLAVVLDFERYPEWARDVKQVTIHERDAEGRGSKVEFRAAGLGKSFRYTLAYDYAQLPTSFSWTLVEGEMLRQLDGTYRFEADGDGTRVHYDLVVDLSAPLPGLIKRRAAGMIMGTALRELKKAVEQRGRA
jgi:ribosome-associated toxin RatA of RatAB toxin-antitoxin module